VLEEGIGNVEDVIGELGVAARPVRQLAAERVLRNLRKGALRRLLDGEAGNGRHRQHLPRPLDAGDTPS
jgi:hypothetical protein